MTQFSEQNALHSWLRETDLEVPVIVKVGEASRHWGNILPEKENIKYIMIFIMMHDNSDPTSDEDVEKQKTRLRKYLMICVGQRRYAQTRLP